METDQVPTEEYAPTAIVLRDTVFFLASSKEKSVIYNSADPISGKWEMANDSLEIPVWDPAFFQDDNGELYLYWGCSNVDPLYGVKINDMTFKVTLLWLNECLPPERSGVGEKAYLNQGSEGLFLFSGRGIAAPTNRPREKNLFFLRVF